MSNLKHCFCPQRDPFVNPKLGKEYTKPTNNQFKIELANIPEMEL
jgi:hypothetical protein